MNITTPPHLNNPINNLDTLTSDNTEYYIYIGGFICSIASVLGTIFIIISYHVYEDVRKKFFYFMVLQIGIGNLAIAVSGPFLDSPIGLDRQLCSLIGLVKSYGLITSTIWTGLISWVVYYSLKHEKTNEDLDNMKIKTTLLIIVNLISLVISLIPYINNDYGNGLGIYCWLDNDGSLRILLLMVIELLLPFILTALTFIYCYFKTYNILNQIVIFQKKTDMYILFIYPIILLLCNFSTVLNTLLAYFYNQQNLILLIISDITRQSQGLINAIVFISTSIIRNKISMRLHATANEAFLFKNNDYYSYHDDISTSTSSTSSTSSINSTGKASMATTTTTTSTTTVITTSMHPRRISLAQYKDLYGLNSVIVEVSSGCCYSA